MQEGSRVVRGGGLKAGVNVTENKHGVYCECEKRKGSCLIYATHTLHLESGMLVAVVFELFVDRNEGTTTHRQWVQKTEESVACQRRRRREEDGKNSQNAPKSKTKGGFIQIKRRERGAL